MTTFEEQFPSLRNWLQQPVGELAKDKDMIEKLFLDFCKQIEYHCLDKQKVKEAIEKVFSVFGEEDYEVVEFKNDLLKELGL